jgi:hypothetical protein
MIGFDLATQNWRSVDKFLRATPVKNHAFIDLWRCEWIMSVLIHGNGGRKAIDPNHTALGVLWVGFLP